MLVNTDTAYNSYVGLLHICLRCRKPLETLDPHIKFCTVCKRQKGNERIRKWRAKQKMEVIA